MQSPYVNFQTNKKFTPVQRIIPNRENGFRAVVLHNHSPALHTLWTLTKPFVLFFSAGAKLGRENCLALHLHWKAPGSWILVTCKCSVKSSTLSQTRLAELGAEERYWEEMFRFWQPVHRIFQWTVQLLPLYFFMFHSFSLKWIVFWYNYCSSSVFLFIESSWAF